MRATLNRPGPVHLEAPSGNPLTAAHKTEKALPARRRFRLAVGVGENIVVLLPALGRFSGDE